MSPRTGRPTDSRKDNDIKVRIDGITHYKLLKYCEERQITKAEAIRRSLATFFKVNKELDDAIKINSKLKEDLQKQKDPKMAETEWNNHVAELNHALAKNEFQIKRYKYQLGMDWTESEEK